MFAVAIAARADMFAQGGVARFKFVEHVDKGEGGNLFIVYNDRTRVAAPRQKDWHRKDGPTSYDEPAIASDRQTVGWLVNFKNSGTSYDIPLSLMVYRSGHLVREVGDGFAISEWHFLSRGKEVVFHSGTVHGDNADHSTRVDIATGKVIATHKGVLDENSPDWAKPPK
jgi:hypothetical protein